VPADAEALGKQNDPAGAGEESWWGYRAATSVAARLAAADAIGDKGGLFVVVDDAGAVVGDVSWVQLLNGPPPQGQCYNIGVWIAPEHRGKGHGAEAQRLLAAYLFDTYYLERVEASTDVDNIGEQRALEKAGFTREGVLRHACFRAGHWRDMVLFSKLRGEP
jgi:RimJ/RimL family protein N-acetyltransferase